MYVASQRTSETRSAFHKEWHSDIWRHVYQDLTSVDASLRTVFQQPTNKH